MAKAVSSIAVAATGRVKEARVHITSLPLCDLYEFPNNPNEESTHVFNNLLMEIQEDGFDQPIIVVDRMRVEDKPGWSVVSGNHRFRALKMHGYTHADCVVKDWDAEYAKIKVVRRNLITGELNTERFTKLVDSIRTPYTPDQVADALGFTSIETFAKNYKKQHEKEERAHEDYTAGDPTKLVEGMTVLLNKLFAEYGDTVPHSFMYFLNGGKVHLAVQTNTQLRRVIGRIAKRCISQHLDINLILAGALTLGLTALDKSTKDVLLAGAEDVELDEEMKPVVGRSASEVGDEDA
jgi:hypothetical protein